MFAGFPLRGILRTFSSLLWELFLQRPSGVLAKAPPSGFLVLLAAFFVAFILSLAFTLAFVPFNGRLSRVSQRLANIRRRMFADFPLRGILRIFSSLLWELFLQRSCDVLAKAPPCKFLVLLAAFFVAFILSLAFTLAFVPFNGRLSHVSRRLANIRRRMFASRQLRGILRFNSSPLWVLLLQ